MLLIIFILFPKIGHQFCFFKEWGSHGTVNLHFIFNNNKERIIPYFFSDTKLNEFTFREMLQTVAGLLTDIVPTSGSPRISHTVLGSILIDLCKYTNKLTQSRNWLSINKAIFPTTLKTSKKRNQQQVIWQPLSHHWNIKSILNKILQPILQEQQKIDTHRLKTYRWQEFTTQQSRSIYFLPIFQ